jgi:Protein of unknown function (DUF1573)
MLSGWKKNALGVAFLAAFVMGLGATARLVRADDNDHAKEPKMVVPETRYEFGTITEGHEVKHDFIVENKGQAPLIIQHVRPD